MNLEIHNPELVQRMNGHIQTATSTTLTNCKRRLLMPSKRKCLRRRRRNRRRRAQVRT